MTATRPLSRWRFHFEKELMHQCCSQGTPSLLPSIWTLRQCCKKNVVSVGTRGLSLAAFRYCRFNFKGERFSEHWPDPILRERRDMDENLLAAL